MSSAPTKAFHPWLLTGAALTLFAGATLLAWLAQEVGRPVSAALVYLLGVLLIGAGWGLRTGLIAALSASVIYNFFLSEPVLRFSVTSLDELVPLIAFNLTAICSGALAGRLNDRARVAEKASRELNLLLELSTSLQQALDLPGIGSALDDVIRRFDLGHAEVYVLIDGDLQAATHSSDYHRDAAEALESGSWGGSDPLLQPLIFSGEVRGVLAHRPSGNGQHRKLDWSTVAGLLTIAIERALLFGAAAEREALRRSEAFKTTLLASVSHDLRTPLAAMIASASSLRSFGEQLSLEERHKMMTVIQEQCARLDRYTSNLLSLAKLESEAVENGSDVIDIADLLGSALAGFRKAYPEHEISKALATGPILIHGNAALVEQVFVNIFENAGRYSPAGTKVGVSLFCKADDAIVWIEDEGRGIAPHEIDRIFDRFYRSPETTDVIGQGLGLSIARGIVERFGGRVAAHSPGSRGHGTRMEVSFPLIRDNE